MSWVSFSQKNVTTGDATTAELIEIVLEEAAIDSASDTDCDDGDCTLQSVTLVTSAAAIAAVDNIVFVAWAFRALPEL